MPKWAYVDQGVQGLNIYQLGKQQGNQQMMQQGLDLVARASDALRGITSVQAARQQMELARAAEGRAQQLHPIAVRQQTAAARQAELAATEAETEAERNRQALERVKAMINADPKVGEMLAGVAETTLAGMKAKAGIATETERQKKGFYRAGVGAEMAEIGEKTARAVTGAARAEAEQPWVESVARAEGLKAEEDIRAMEARRQERIVETTAQIEAGTLNVQKLKNLLEQNVTFDQLGHLKESMNIARRTKVAEVKLLENEVEKAQAEKELSDFDQVAARYDIVAPYVLRIADLWKALQSTIKSGNTGIFEQFMAATYPTYAAAMVTKQEQGGIVSMADVQMAYMSVINMYKDILSQHGFELDEIRGTVRYTGRIGQAGPTLGERAGVLPRARAIDRGLKSAYEERPGVPLGPPVPGEPDVDTILKYLEQ